MPTPRPSSPASLSTTDPVALNARSVWLVDAAGNVPDLVGNEPNLVLAGSPTFATTGVLGPHLTGNGSASATSTPIAPKISATPYAVGAIFATVGAKSGGSGYDPIATLGCESSTPAIYTLILVDDGTFNAAGHLTVLVFINVSGGGINIDCGAVDNAALHAISVAIAVSGVSAISYAISLDGSTTSGTTGSGENFSGGIGLPFASILSWVDYSGVRKAATSNLQVALKWYSTAANLTNAQYNTWTGDPWTILQASAAGDPFPLPDRGLLKDPMNTLLRM